MERKCPTILPLNIQVLTVAAVIFSELCKYKEISARLPSQDTSYENDDCFNSYIASLICASSKIELNTTQTSSWAENEGICSFKSKHHVCRRCKGIPSDIYDCMNHFWKEN